MIRINLLPIKEARRRASAKRFLIASLVILLVEVGIFTATYWVESNRYTELSDKVSKVKQKMEKRDEIQNEISTLNAQIKSAKQKIDVLEGLKNKRRASFDVMFELQSILTAATTERLRIIQRKRNWDDTWNPGRLWISKFTGTDESLLIVGKAMNPADVAEFLFRLESSDYFVEPQLDFVKNTDIVAEKGGRVVKFRITGDIGYTPSNEKDG